MTNNFLAKNLANCTLQVARCELNKLTDCNITGLSIAVSHIGGTSRHSIVTVHQQAADHSCQISVMNVCISWDANTSILQFKQAISLARKIMSDHNKAIRNRQAQCQQKLLPAQHSSKNQEYALRA